MEAILSLVLYFKPLRDLSLVWLTGKNVENISSDKRWKFLSEQIWMHPLDRAYLFYFCLLFLHDPHLV
jgi:hypothetical protein